VTGLVDWYAAHGRHDLPWRATRDPWAVLVSEVMLQQTQVSRVLDVWPAFMAEFPDAATMAAASPGAVIAAWGRLGYPRRARRLHDAAVVIARDGWPEDLRALPGVGAYTAGAIADQVHDDDLPAIDVNIRRVLERRAGRLLTPKEADAAYRRTGRPLRGRDRLLAIMDLGAAVCRARDPQCGACPLRRGCATRGPLPGEVRTKQAPFEGSFRQRRGRVMARLRDADAVPVRELDPEALESLVADGLAMVTRGRASLP
jgi:A/G-specific adenine glycosylase